MRPGMHPRLDNRNLDNAVGEEDHHHTDLRRALPAAVNALAELCYPEDSDWQQCEEISLFSNGLCSCATNATTQRAN